MLKKINLLTLFAILIICFFTVPAFAAVSRVPINSVVLSYESTEYTGKAQKPAVTVTVVLNGKTVTLEKGTDYTVSYSNNTNAGTATVRVKGKGSYRSSISSTFEITPAKITSASLKYDALKYTGKPRTQTGTTVVSAVIGGKTKILTKGTDYKITYKNNVNVGTARMTIEGKGNYTGTIVKKFKIKPKALSSLSPGDIVDGNMISGIESKYFKSYAIRDGDEVYNYINGKSYKENPYVALSDLRYIKVLHYNFDHRIQVGEMIVNKAIAKDVLHIFRELFDAEYEICSMYLIDRFWTGDPDSTDDMSCHYNNTSCFCYRTATRSSSISRHALGMAIDINPQQNPYVWYENGKKTVYDKNSKAYIDRSSGAPHMIVTGDICWKTFTGYGFDWGGDWSDPIDYQHWERR